MPTEDTVEAEVILPIEGKLTVALNHPTPIWVRKIVRALVWISGGWVAMGWAGVLTDMGVPPSTVEKMGKVMPIIATIASIAARYLGIKPTDNDSLTDKEEPPSQIKRQPEGKPD